MRRMALLPALLVACSTSVAPTNPYDPAAPVAQQARGQVVGRLSPSVLPADGATVRLLDGSAAARSSALDASGAFAFADVPPGTYQLELLVPGFSALVRSGLVVTPGATLDLGTLEPVDGRPTQAGSVSVTAVDPVAAPGFVSCAASAPSPCQVMLALTADDNPVELQIGFDAAFAGAAWQPLPATAQPWMVSATLPGGADDTVWVHVRFRDAAGNTSAGFVAPIARRSTPPSATDLGFPSLQPDGGGAFFTGQLPLAVALQATGATRMRVSCDTTEPLATRPWVAFNPAQTCVLVPGDGTKTVSAQFMDEAGNASAPVSRDVWLQQTLPEPPSLTVTSAGGDAGSRTLVTGPTTVITSSARFTVQVAASASAGPLFARLEARTGFGLPAAVAADGLSVAFTLRPGEAATLSRNELMVRVVDKAGNAGWWSTVHVDQEPATGALPATGLALQARPQSVQLAWTRSASAYATGYLVEYGPTAGYGGTGADQGVSPVQVGNPCDAAGTCRYVLTGLSDFAPEYVRLTTLSALQSGQQASGGPVTPQPLGLTVVGTRALSTRAVALAVADDRAYVVVADGLQIVDLSHPASPALLGKATFDASYSSTATSGLELRWPLAYVAGPDGLYVFDVSSEAVPVRRGKLATARAVTAVALRHPRAYLQVAGLWGVGGTTELQVVDVSNPAAPARVNGVMNPDYGGSDYGALAVVGDTVWFGTIANVSLQAASVAGVTGAVAPSWISGSQVYVPHVNLALAVDPGPRRLVYALENSGTLRTYDFTAPGAPQLVTATSGVPGAGMALAGSDVYLVGGGRIEVLDTADLANPRIAGTLALPATVGSGTTVAVAGTTVVVGGTGGLGVLQAAHLAYPRARGQAWSLGNLTGGGRIEIRGRSAIVPGNGIALFDLAPEAPRMTASNQGIFASGSDFGLGYGFAGGLALSGDLVFSAFGTQANSGAGLMVFRLGTYSGTCPGPACVPCGLAQRLTTAAGVANPAPRYYGLAVQGGYLYAALGGSPTTRTLDIYDLSSFAALAACSSAGPFAAAPAPAATFALQGDPRDVAVHRGYGFVAETDGLEILDLSAPAAPVRLVRQAGESGVSAIGVRLGTCPAGACYRIHLATTSGVRSFTWAPGDAAATPVASLGTLGAASSVLTSLGTLVQGCSATGGLGFYDGAPAAPAFQSYSTPQPAGGVQALGAAGRFVYANDNGAFVVMELQ